MFKILIVDQDKTVRSEVKEKLEKYRQDFKVYQAAGGKAGISSLKKYQIDLIVLDLNKDDLEGFDLLAQVRSRYETIPVIVVSHSLDQLEEELRSIGSFEVMEKPLDYQLLIHFVTEGIKPEKNEFIRGLSFPLILQVIAMERKTCTLHVSSNKFDGKVYFDKGILINAETDGVEGVKAIYKMVTWGKVDIDIERVCRKKKVMIFQDLNYVLLEGHRRLDETNRKGNPVNNKPLKKEGKMFEQSFEKISKINGFLASGIYNSSGEILDSHVTGDIDMNEIGGLAIELYLSAKSVCDKMNIGTADFVEVHTSDYIYIHACIVPGKGAMGVLLQNGGNIGLARHYMKNEIKKLIPEFS